MFSRQYGAIGDRTPVHFSTARTSRAPDVLRSPSMILREVAAAAVTECRSSLEWDTLMWNTVMDRPERTAALDYLRRKGTEAPVSKLFSGLRTTFQTFEQAIDRVPEAVRTEQPTATSWCVHQIVDHLVETHRRALAELRDLRQGISPVGGPIPARLVSPNALDRPWTALIEELKSVHANMLDVVAGAEDAASLVARAPFVMVITVQGEHGPEVLEWVERVDWKAYAQAIRVHTHEHLAQVERTVAAVTENRPGAGSSTT